MYGLLSNPVFNANQVQLDLEVRVYVHGMHTYTYIIYAYITTVWLYSSVIRKLFIRMHTYVILLNFVWLYICIYIFLQGKIKAASLSMSHASLQLPAVGSTDKMFHLLLTDTFFVTAITAAIHSGLLHHKIPPDQVNLYTITV